jgi:hypothetical protein
VRRRPKPIQQAALGEQEGAGAYARGHLGTLILRNDPIQYRRVEPLTPRALSTGDDDDVERWMMRGRHFLRENPR